MMILLGKITRYFTLAKLAMVSKSPRQRQHSHPLRSRVPQYARALADGGHRGKHIVDKQDGLAVEKEGSSRVQDALDVEAALGGVQGRLRARLAATDEAAALHGP